MPGLRLSLLGPLTITLDGEPFAGIRLRPILALCIYLACRPERHRREHLMALLWPDFPQTSAQQNLRQNLYVLRHALPEIDSQNGGSVPLMLADRDTLQLNPAAVVEVDVLRFAALLAHPQPTPLQLAEAAALYRGDFLTDFYLPDSEPFEEWAEARRADLRRMMLEALDKLTVQALKRDSYGEAMAYARRQLEIDNLRESAHRQLMLALAHSGQRASALNHYEACRRLLHDELGVEPEARTQILAKRIAAEQEAPPAIQPDMHLYTGTMHHKRPRHNLPLQLTSFIGREREIIEIRRLLDISRLVTVSGVGGSGKTRLALEAAKAMSQSFSDGVWFVEFAPLSDPLLIASLVASKFGLLLDKDRSVTDALVDYLRDRKALLLFDNCEHLIEPVAQLVETLLQHCPTLRVLATSRERLEIDGEIIWSAPALSLPPPDELPSIGSLLRYDAVRLFSERASAALPGFKLTQDNAAAVTYLCRQLDGMPMAIELAAVKVGLLRVEQIVERLNDRFRLLVGGNRTAPPRHQSLRALIDWSYDLLPPVEQRLLRRLPVFANGFTLEAAEAVCDEENEGGTLESLTQLVNKSLVVVDRASGRSARYGLHETIRQYGLERLADEGAVESMRERHATYYRRLAEEAEPQLYKVEQMLWLDRLEESYDNLRAALGWSLIDGATNAETGLRLAAALANYWEMRGILVEGHHWLTVALEKVNSAAIPLQASFYLKAGNFWLEHGGNMRVVGANESLALYQRLEDERGIAWALRLQGNCALFRENDLERATVLFEQSLALAEEVDDKALMSRICQNLGRATMHRGDYPGAIKLGEKGLALARETGDRFAVGYLSFLLGMTAARQGNYAAAEAFHLDALAVCRDLKLEVNTAKTLIPLGEAVRLQKKYDQAVRYYQEQIRLSQGIAGWETAYSTYSLALVNLGHVAIRRGDPRSAAGLFRESIDIDKDINVGGDLVSWNLWGLGLVAAAVGRATQAARLYAVVDKMLEANNDELAYPEDREDFRRDIASVREQLGEGDFTAAWAEGRRMSPEEALAYALEEFDNPPMKSV